MTADEQVNEGTTMRTDKSGLNGTAVLSKSNGSQVSENNKTNSKSPRMSDTFRFRRSRTSVTDENDDNSPSPSVNDKTASNVVGNTKDRPNPLRFLLLQGDKADENEQRYDSSDEKPSPDKQRERILAGVYNEENVTPYYPRESFDASTRNNNNNNTNGDVANDTGYFRNSMTNLDNSGFTDQNSERRKSRPSNGRRNTKASESDQQDQDDLQSTWKKRFKFGATPTSLTFNMGANNGPETPGSDGKKWNNFRSSILGFKKKDKPLNAPTLGYTKEDVDKDLDEKTKQRAEFLMSSLIAGCPAALFASSILLRDEHGTQRAPLLLPLLGFQLIDITEKSKHKHRTFKIELEYGISPTRLKWSIIKDTRDFMLLHSRLKLLFFQSNAFSKKDIELPKLPRWDHEVRTLRQKGLLSHERRNTNILTDGTFLGIQDPSHPRIPESQHDDTQSIGSVLSHSSGISHRIRHDIGRLISRMSSRPDIDNDPEEFTALSRLFKDSMERYINQLNLTLLLKPQSNRVFQFFELSPIGVLLSSEHGYQGKQGYLLVRTSAKAQGWRVGHLKFRELKDMVDRHTNKWFLIRNNYIMYVEDIYSTTPLEVFLVDSSIKVDFTGANDDLHQRSVVESEDEGSLLDERGYAKEVKKKSPYLTIKLENNERKIKMIVRSERQLNLWLTSINTMISKTIWSQPKRFNSFAPVRDNCFAQWFVDARDYMWACSSALEMAKETIYIHDWWLSPELYMRRPANGNQQWRLDRILKRKAEQGVKIFVIIYRNVGNTVVTDSSWTKHSLLDLHPNVYVIRSPNQLLQNTYFWAHHEKLAIIDSTICFVGGIDLCYGRFDTPDHVLTDDAHSAFPEADGFARAANEDDIRFQNFPGKDYSNPRVKDFFSLDKPYESMYDRNDIPRMPWHDVHMISAGQIARDLSRHFVQRWNYLLRQKRPSRPTPLLVPPTDMTQQEIVNAGLDGTCEVQLLRSSGSWSLGLKKHEQSIQDAYLKLIETSEHFVYLENQFFITSAEWDGTVIHNRIGDALVDRIIRAHTEGKDWRAVIVIPLMPGFEAQVSEADGSAVRVIMQCQFMSISRGSTSIFAKLRKVGIDPDDYIQFFSLRKWGKIGPDKKLVTEQLYIHAKTIMADDRVAIIGSANINERSMRGDRDSEVVAIVRDKEMVKTKMNGKPYLAGKFAHTLRMRLMREHLGVDVDMLELVERRFGQLETIAKTEVGKCASTGRFTNEDYHIASAMVELATREVLNEHEGTERWHNFMKSIGARTNIDIPMEEEELPESLREAKKFMPHPLYHSFNHRAGIANLGMRDKKKFSSDSRIHNNRDHKNDIDGFGKDKYNTESFRKSRKNINKVIEEWAKDSLNNSETYLPNVEQVLEYLNDDEIEYDGNVLKELNIDEEEHLLMKNNERWLFLKRIAYLQRCAGKQKSMEELNSAKNNIDPVSSDKSEGQDSSTPEIKHEADFIHAVSLDDQGIRDALQSFVSTGNSNHDQFIDPYGFEDPLDEEFYEDVWYANAVRNTRLYRMVFHCQPDDAAESWTDYTRLYDLENQFAKAQKQDIPIKPETETPEMANGSEVKSFNTPNKGLGVLGLRTGEEARDEDTLTNSSKRSVPSSSTASTSEDGTSPDKLEAKETVNFDEHNQHTAAVSPNSPHTDTPRRRRRAGTFASRHRNAAFGETIYEKQTAEKILNHIQGHLVLFPADWLHMELEKGGSWFFNADRLPPIEIYD